MTALAANSTVLTFGLVGYEADQDFDIDASATIYAGSFVGVNSGTGYARACVAADAFLGVAKRACDNSGSGSILGLTTNIGSGAAANTTVAVATKGHFFWQSTITGAAGTDADIGTVVYCTDSGALTTTSTSNTKVGTIVAYGTTNAGNARYEIAFQSAAERTA